MLEVSVLIKYMSSKVTVTRKNPTTVHRTPITPRQTVKTTVTPKVVKTESVKSEPVKVNVKAVPTVVKTAPKAVAVVKTVAKVTPVVQAKTEVSAKMQIKPKKKRQRPKIRSFTEIYENVHSDIETAYKHLQTAYRSLKSLESAHNREVHNTKSRESNARTPTIIFDQALVDYFRLRLEPEELVVMQKTQTQDGPVRVPVDLSDLSVNTKVHRTDVTQLYNLVFKKHQMQDPEDGRQVLYQTDPALVALLTTGSYSEKLEEQVQQIRNGEFRLTIFNIQRFTSHHLGRVALPPKNKRSDDDDEQEAQDDEQEAQDDEQEAQDDEQEAQE